MGMPMTEQWFGHPGDWHQRGFGDVFLSNFQGTPDRANQRILPGITYAKGVKDVSLGLLP